MVGEVRLMASYEQIDGLVTIVTSDGSFRNYMFENRIRGHKDRVKIPEKLTENKNFNVLIQQINRFASGSVIVGRCWYGTKYGSKIKTESYLYCHEEADCVAIKLGIE